MIKPNLFFHQVRKNQYILAKYDILYPGTPSKMVSYTVEQTDMEADRESVF